MQQLTFLVSALLLSRTWFVFAEPTTSAAAPLSTACGDIVNDEDDYIFDASLVYECLTSVPFIPAVATRFIEYLNDTLQFQSTLHHLKSPPPSYQQPSVDLLQGLSFIQAAINNGSFANQYEFEAALQTLLIAAHDNHLWLDAGVISAFSFGSPFDIVTVSIDGVQLPKVYLADDLTDSASFTLYQPSAISHINGKDVTEFLEQWASRNSIGRLEPHADWNSLMFSYAQDIQGYWNTFSGGATFYPGEEITFTFENKTTLTQKFQGIYYSQGPTGPLETGGDFYNYFVLGFLPASFNAASDGDGNTDAGDDGETADDSTATVTSLDATPTASEVPASTTTALSGWEFYDPPVYPINPDVAQPDVGAGGWLTGYFFPRQSLAVLSIPSFDEARSDVNAFQETVTEFLQKSKAANLSKVVVDLQQNSGGSILLAIDTFRRFFPTIQPFAGSRMRAHYSADALGETMTGLFESLKTTDDSYVDLAANEWVAVDRINANTGRNFSSWEEFYGPHTEGADNFTTTQRYNLSSTVFAESAFNGEANFSVYSSTAPAPFKPDQIILLTDGICSSACSLFLEMMHHEAGVRIVVAGGKPVPGPMQAASGSRGARSYSLDVLDANIDFIQKLLQEDGRPATFLPNRTLARSIFTVGGSVNLRDQVRRGETIPLQFAYNAADCRIWYTPQTIRNYTALWNYAAEAIWSNPKLCVTNSTGYATTGTNSTDFAGPDTEKEMKPFNLEEHITLGGDGNVAYHNITTIQDGLDGDTPTRTQQSPYPLCDTDDDCELALPNQLTVCKAVRQCKGDKRTNRCVPICLSSSLCDGQCVINKGLNSTDKAYIFDRKPGIRPTLMSGKWGYCDIDPQKCNHGKLIN